MPTPLSPAPPDGAPPASIAPPDPLPHPPPPPFTIARATFRELLAATAVLLLAIGVFFGPTFLSGRRITTDGWLWLDAMYRDGLADPAYVPYYMDDPTPHVQNYPWDLFSARSWRAGRVPLWNPNQGCGTPHLANFQSAPFYPLKLLLVLWPTMDGYNLYLLLRLLVAGILMYVYARGRRLSHPAGVLASVAWTFCGFALAHFHYASLQSVGLLPLLLHVVELGIAAPTFRWGIGLGATFGLILLSGHPEIVFEVLFAGGGYYVVRVAQSWRAQPETRRVARLLTLSLAGAGLGLLLALVDLLPFLEHLGNAWTYKRQSGEVEAASRHAFSAGGFSLVVSLFCPNLFEGTNPLFAPGAPGQVVRCLSNARGLLTYPGIGVLALACYAAGTRRAALVEGLAVAMELGLVLDLPLVRGLMNLPIREYSFVLYTLFVLSFALAMMAGRGFDGLLEDLASGRGRRIAWLALLFPVGPALFAAYYHHFVLAAPPEAFGNWYQSDRHLRVLAEQAGAWVGLWPQVATKVLVSWGWLATLLGLAALGAARRLGRRALAAGIVVVCAADLLLAGAPAIPAQTKFGYPESPALAFLRSRPGPFRVLGLYGGNNTPNNGTAIGIADVRVLDPLLVERYRDVFLLGDPNGGATYPNWMDSNRPDTRLWNLMNVRYLIRSRAPAAALYTRWPENFAKTWVGGLPLAEAAIDPQRYRVTYQDARVELLENRRALPRAFTVTQALPVEPGREALSAALWDGRGDDLLWDERFVVEDVDGERDVLLGSLPGDAAAPVEAELSTLEPDRVVVRPNRPTPVLLVLADTFYPGWEACVDGERATIFPVNGMFRGVFLPPGPHVVEFDYRPVPFRNGACASAAALVLCLAGRFWRGRRPEPRA
ncbi:MAG: hypothetical protein HYZ53_19705 [Planctomycetes bacterium]|nr:hypothetical protein [Planctomycetota bacterium]